MNEATAKAERLAAANKLLSALGKPELEEVELLPGVNLLANTLKNANSETPWLSWGFTQPISQIDSSAFFWCPRGRPSGKSMFIASSRLGQRPDKQPDWFQAFRTTVCRLHPSHDFLISATGTTADRFIRRAAELFELKVLDFRSTPNPLSDFKAIDTDCFENLYPCYVIPISKTNPRIQWDHLLLHLADEVRLLSVQKGGQVAKAVQSRIQAKPDNSNVFLLDSESLTKPKFRDQLCNAGCHRWLLFDQAPIESTTTNLEFRIPLVDQLPYGEFLIHCTRPRVGAWPDQNEAEFLDDLIFENPRSNHSANASLARILATGVILGSNQLTRAPQKVVCFTDVAFDKLHQLKKFRSHLSRWDFLPVGIAIRKSALQFAGAKPVAYGDESDWQSMDESEKPWFQIAKSITAKGNEIDWRLEQEWRYVGDLDLHQFQPGDVFAINQAKPEEAS